MNRNDEYIELLTELENIPTWAEYTVTRNVNRSKIKRRIRNFGLSFATIFIAFVFAVNVFPSVAYAAGQIPLLRELAKAVSFSPSLEAAVENEYVQPMNLSQTQNGITVEIEYLIVDKKNVNIFYTINSEKYEKYYDSTRFNAVDGTSLGAHSYGGGTILNGEINTTRVLFQDKTVPSEFLMDLKVEIPEWFSGKAVTDEPVDVDNDDNFLFDDPVYEDPDYIAEFTFHLELDPYFTEQGEVFELNKEVDIAGQKLTITSLEIYPTQIRMSVLDNISNSHEIKSIDFYLENDKGEIYDRAGGITAFGSPTSDEMIYNIESDYFDKSESLTLHILSVDLLDKEHEYVHLDLENLSADFLPEGVSFHSAEEFDDGYILEFKVKTENEFLEQIFMNNFKDADGNEYDISSTSSYFSDEEDGGQFHYTSFPLKDFHEKEAWVMLRYSEIVEFDTPISVKLK